MTFQGIVRELGGTGSEIKKFRKLDVPPFISQLYPASCCQALLSRFNLSA
jgi:hypothetical protein